ncbi:ABC transporter ATP-binding protein [Flavonifractor plautii]|uniref:ABC transporter ATP-binding protein n=1 Tax=Flavonifractor plautii TaxID=292800 RepID=A0AAX1KF80_FLAPL|nr:ABC transporter ATP-binding protein [Flavonifractor plautii]ANU42541.1 ABC transporter ATP-binding protein [Flavonifractor plautii]OXE48185.1 ABC transporter ATP-binding protein [Flavonifractor plautii]QQR04552.1 ABC transporter ATP-binding protein [Flavonifractor plautii]UQA25348.1 ABC transporter ATP-binding protein [Flavonifractor plautii]
MAGKTDYKNQWQKDNVDRVNLTMPKGKKDIIRAHAEAQGESTTGFINRAIDETMERDKSVPGAAGEPTEDRA